ncbi:MAG: YHS domain-containing (seleno)protein [Pseudomonadales bacterium]
MRNQLASTILFLAVAVHANAASFINTTFFGNLAIEGYDPVAYFIEDKPVKGDSEFEYEWQAAHWRFSSAENRDLFVSNPEKYAPQYGGYCAYAVSQDTTAGIDPDQFTIVDDKLYLNYSAKVRETWRADRDAYILAADKNWPGVVQ